MLASVDLMPSSFAVDSTHAYVITVHDVHRISLADGADVVLMPPVGNSILSDIVVDETHAYFTDGSDCCGSVARIPLAGGASETLVDNRKCATSIALVANDVFWTEACSSSAVRKVPRAGGTVQEFPTLAVFGLAVSGDEVLAGNDTLVAIRPSTGAVRTLATKLGYMRDVVVDDAFAYVLSTPVGPSNVAILRVPLSGGPPVQLAVGDPDNSAAYYRRIAVHRGFVLWTEADRLRAVPATGGAIVDVASTTGIARVLVHEEAVYLLDSKSLRRFP
ncbi:Hypothetical protein A7982_02091 [Minicystis rosea]|nr:Hypothetical protein A7982_02091 [Minicystis rosea]